MREFQVAKLNDLLSCSRKLDAMEWKFLKGLDPHHEYPYGERSGPDAYSAEFLDCLWKEYIADDKRRRKLPDFPGARKAHEKMSKAIGIE